MMKVFTDESGIRNHRYMVLGGICFTINEFINKVYLHCALNYALVRGCRTTHPIPLHRRGGREADGVVVTP